MIITYDIKQKTFSSPIPITDLSPWKMGASKVSAREIDEVNEVSSSKKTAIFESPQGMLVRKK
jgi:hypothetical protein